MTQYNGRRSNSFFSLPKDRNLKILVQEPFSRPLINDIRTEASISCNNNNQNLGKQSKSFVIKKDRQKFCFPQLQSKKNTYQLSHTKKQKLFGPQTLFLDTLIHILKEQDFERASQQVSKRRLKTEINKKKPKILQNELIRQFFQPREVQQEMNSRHLTSESCSRKVSLTTQCLDITFGGFKQKSAILSQNPFASKNEIDQLRISKLKKNNI